MASKRNQHVVPHDKGWAVRSEGAERVTVVVPTQEEATTIARDIARRRHGELFVHGADGRIRERDSHGRDPRSSKG
jgi:hypothetical protein